jgi:hypothetical protein
MLKKDFSGFATIMKGAITKDFKYIEAGQTMTFDQMLSNMKMGMSQYKKITKSQTKVFAVQVQGNKATATVWHMMEGTMMGPDKKKHTVSYSGNAIESYVKVGKMWKMTTMDWRDTKSLMDGKAFDPMAAAKGK